MPTKTAKRLAFPCLACIREQGHPDNDWYMEVAEIVVYGDVNSQEIWALLRRREGQHNHNLIHRIICITDDNISLSEKVRKISEVIREFGVPRSEDEHTCHRKDV